MAVFLVPSQFFFRLLEGTPMVLGDLLSFFGFQPGTHFDSFRQFLCDDKSVEKLNTPNLTK